jgi:hypothetical protein
MVLAICRKKKPGFFLSVLRGIVIDEVRIVHGKRLWKFHSKLKN